MTARRVALVTGASRGIGAAIARRLGSENCVVVGTATTADGVARIDAMLTAASVPGRGIEMHVESADSVAAALASITEREGAIEILVNNAGITRDMLAVRMKDEDWQAVLDVNLTAGFRLARAALKGMMKRRHGRIIGITSIVGVTGNAGQANYAAAKAGMIGMSKSLAAEVATRGITVNCVAPGFIETAMTGALNEQQRERIKGAIPAGRFGQGNDIAAAVVYLASDEAAYMTGQTLHVNGGMAMI